MEPLLAADGVTDVTDVIGNDGAWSQRLRLILYEAATNNITTLSTVRAELVEAWATKSSARTVNLLQLNTELVLACAKAHRALAKF